MWRLCEWQFKSISFPSGSASQSIQTKSSNDAYQSGRSNKWTWYACYKYFYCEKYSQTFPIIHSMVCYSQGYIDIRFRCIWLNVRILHPGIQGISQPAAWKHWGFCFYFIFLMLSLFLCFLSLEFFLSVFRFPSAAIANASRVLFNIT